MDREDIMGREGMEGMGNKCMEGDMGMGVGHRDNMWDSSGRVRGLRRRCWRVWRVVVVWMLVCCFKRGMGREGIGWVRKDWGGGIVF